MSFERDYNYPSYPEVSYGGEEKVSAFHPVSLFDLFLRPWRFFGGRVDLTGSNAVYLAVLIYGVVIASCTLAKQVMQAEQRGQAMIELYAKMTATWASYWPWILIIGLVNGAITYQLGGWWYRMRLAWSGVDAPDPDKARALFIYSAMIYSLPQFLLRICDTWEYDNYLAAISAQNWWDWIIVVLPLWSCLTSYLGARACFNARSARAVIWFLVLPLIYYGVGVASYFCLLATAW